MDGTTIAVAVISASGAIVVGVLQLLKPKPKDVSAPPVGTVSDSMVAVGTNISQSYSPTVHNHYAPAQDADLFASKVESTPTIADIIDDLEKVRRPYEANQAHKLYVGLRVCWPVTVYGVWEDSSRAGSCTVRLASLDHISNAAIVRVDINEYPKLKVVERGHRAWVEGQIRDVGSGQVYLEDGARITLK